MYLNAFTGVADLSSRFGKAYQVLVVDPDPVWQSIYQRGFAAAATGEDTFQVTLADTAEGVEAALTGKQYDAVITANAIPYDRQGQGLIDSVTRRFAKMAPLCFLISGAPAPEAGLREIAANYINKSQFADQGGVQPIVEALKERTAQV